MKVNYLLRRHPFPVTTFFDHTLVLTYALPAGEISSLLPHGLTLDTYGDFGFVAIALVATRHTRPSFLPAGMGISCSLIGYRLFVRRRRNDGRLQRGLYVMRSDTDSRLIAMIGNATTHYRYHHSSISWTTEGESLTAGIKTPDGRADLSVTANFTDVPASLPVGSPFENTNDARRFAGPLPWTFSYEPETDSIVTIRGRRDRWDPLLVSVKVQRVTFFEQHPFSACAPIFAAAFSVRNLPYRWDRGTVEASLGRAAGQ